MKTTVVFNDRIQGCMTGAAIGGELGLARSVHPEWFDAKTIRDIRALKLRPAGRYKDEAGRMMRASALPLLDFGFRAYLKTKDRPTPEDFAAMLKSDPGVAIPDFAYDGLHSTQELLKEGMHPRIAGMGNAPCGLIAAAMPAVGIFHFADPQRAYLEGVELASVTQPRLGADWAGLCAAAVSAALAPDATPETIIASMLKIAHEHNRDLFYELRTAVRSLPKTGGEKALVAWWLNSGSKSDLSYRQDWVAYNPARYALPLLPRYDADPDTLFALILAANPGGAAEWMGRGHQVATVIAGAIVGALHGPSVFSPAWRRRVGARLAGWKGMPRVVASRLRKEKQVISVVERLVEEKSGGRTLLTDKILGNILAGAIGNAMGSPVEGRFYREIDRAYPDGIQTVLEPQRLESEDDNQMAMLLTETYLDRGGAPVMARHFGDTWTRRLNRLHFFPMCMGNAYDMIRSGMDARITGHWSWVTGSTVMCMEPAGLFNLAAPRDASLDVTAISYMYQRGLDVLAAANMAATVAEAMRPEATVDSVCRAALDTAPKGPLRTFDKRPFRGFRDYLETCLTVADKYQDVLKARKELYEKCLFYHAIDPLELWGLSLAMFKIAQGDVRQAAIGGTNIGRDSDTIAGRAAMLAGTLRGAENVPAEWIAMFKPEVMDKIRGNAGRFADLIAGPKLDVMKTRQSLAGASGVFSMVCCPS